MCLNFICVRKQEKQRSVTRQLTGHVVRIRIHKTEWRPMRSVNYCHAGGAGELKRFRLWIVFRLSLFSSSSSLSFFFESKHMLTIRLFSRGGRILDLTVGFHNHTATQLTARWSLVFWAVLDVNHGVELGLRFGVGGNTAERFLKWNCAISCVIVL